MPEVCGVLADQPEVHAGARTVLFWPLSLSPPSGRGHGPVPVPSVPGAGTAGGQRLCGALWPAPVTPCHAGRLPDLRERASLLGRCLWGGGARVGRSVAVPCRGGEEDSGPVLTAGLDTAACVSPAAGDKAGFGVRRLHRPVACRGRRRRGPRATPVGARSHTRHSGRVAPIWGCPDAAGPRCPLCPGLGTPRGAIGLLGEGTTHVDGLDRAQAEGSVVPGVSQHSLRRPWSVPFCLCPRLSLSLCLSF